MFLKERQKRDAYRARIAAALAEFDRRGTGVGDLLVGNDRRSGAFKRLPIIQKLALSWVLSPKGCWEWTGGKTTGYGTIIYGGKAWTAHRLSYHLSIAPVPDELDVDHLCMNKACINPAHLEPVTEHENVLRWARARTHCRGKGSTAPHPWIPENIYAPSSGKPPQCRPCLQEANRRGVIKYREKKRAEAVAAA